MGMQGDGENDTARYSDSSGADTGSRKHGEDTERLQRDSTGGLLDYDHTTV